MSEQIPHDTAALLKNLREARVIVAEQLSRACSTMSVDDCDTVNAAIDAVLAALTSPPAERAQVRTPRERLERAVREPLEIAASYDVPGELVGSRLHGRDCKKALAALDELLTHYPDPSPITPRDHAALPLEQGTALLAPTNEHGYECCCVRCRML